MIKDEILRLFARDVRALPGRDVMTSTVDLTKPVEVSGTIQMTVDQPKLAAIMAAADKRERRAARNRRNWRGT